MPRWVMPVLVLLGAFALVPFACVARARVSPQGQPRLHLVLDMDAQASFRPQEPNPWFADGRAMRPPVDGTVARGELHEDAHLHDGVAGGAYAETFPSSLEITRAFVERGRERYDVYCAPCHGLAGYGDGMVARRADRLRQATWIPPASLHVEPASTRPVGHLYNTIKNGIRSMPPYAAQIPVADRWAIVAYVRALQRSQRASLDDVPAEHRSELR